MKRVVVIVALTVALGVTLTLGIFYILWAQSGPDVVGIWKGVDEYRHEHYFEFHADGTLTWWDKDRAHDGTFTTRGPFKGFYRRKDRETIVAETHGLFAPPLGTLTLISANELKQDGGHAMRDHLVYQRVVPE
jgi:hypothetical protein